MPPSGDFLHKAAQWCLISMVFLLPVWFLPATAAPVEFNKMLIVSVLSFLSFILFLAYSIKSGSVSLPYHRIFIVAGALLLAWLASALASGSKSDLWGAGVEASAFFTTLTLFLASAMIMLLFRDARSLSRLMAALALGFAVFLAMAWVFSVLGLGAKVGGLFAARAFNTVGSWNSVGVAAGFFAAMLYPFLLAASGGMRWAVAALLLAALLLVLAVNFQLVWIILGFFSVLLLAHAIWRKNISFLGVGLPMGLLLLSLFAVLFTAFIAAKTAFPAPLEVGVSHGTTLEVAGKGLRENLVLGAGPNSFGYLWDKYRPVEVNNTPFWGLRFTVGSSYVLSALGGIGLLGWLLLLAFLGWLWYLGLRALAGEERGETEPVVFSVFLTVSFTILMLSLYSAGYVLVALGFVAIGMLLAALRISGAFPAHDFSLVREGPRGFISALVVVFFIILGALGVYKSALRYIGELAYADGAEAAAAGNLDFAERKLLVAAQSEGYNDLYFRTLSQIYMTKAQILLQNRSTPQELLGSSFKSFLDQAVSAAQGAIKAGPMDFLNYRALGQIYSFLVQLGAAGSMEAAQAQYDEAIKRAPTNPLLWRDKAMAYLSDAALKNNRDSLQKAEESLLKAVSLKPDYVEGHFLLAQVFDAEGKSKEAIERGEAAALLAPQDIGTLFQLGLLYYRANRLNDAEIVFKRSVEINTNYSNARYFLGLIYDRRGRRADAVSEFEKILALNPDNAEVEQILSNLRAKKPALSGVAGPAPETRTEPPVTEKNAGSRR